MGDVQLLERTDAGLVVQVQSSAPTTLSWRWLRDHGEDPASFDPDTKQRRVYAIGSEAPKKALDVAEATIDGTDVITIAWSESPTSTWISAATIAQLIAPEPRVRAPIWAVSDDRLVTPGEVDAVLQDDDALAAWLADITNHGYGILRGFSGAHAEATTLANRIGYPRSTIFGTIWDLASDIGDHDDTAYSQTFLAPHTDGTYSHEAPGLQMFCCTERDGTGGESIIVDGFALAETLRTHHRAEFDLLTRVHVPAHYIEPGVELRASRPAIRLNSLGAVVQISMNNYDRSPLLLPEPEMAAFYAAYGRLHEITNDRDRWLSVRLGPGDVLITDNWRVLHGRQAYTGRRRFVGCYLNHEDFESRCRTLGIATQF